MTLVTLLQAMIAAPSTWFAVALLQIVSIFAYTVHNVVTNAYQPDLLEATPREGRDAERNKLNAAATFSTFAAEAVLIVLILGLSIALGLTNAGTAALSQLINGVFVCGFYYFTWAPGAGRFQKRPQKHEIEDASKNLFMLGVDELRETGRVIWRTNRGLGIFLVGLMFADAAFAAFSSIALVFMQTQLGAELAESMAVILIVLIVSLPGSVLANRLMNRFNALSTLIATVVYMAVTCVIAGLVLRGPKQINFVYIFGLLWGTAFGSYYSSYISLFMQIVPKGMELEYMGILMFCRQILTWLPPLAFAGANRLFGDLSWGLYVVAFFFVLSVAFFAFIDLEATKAAVDKLDAARAERRSMDLTGAGAAARVGPTPTPEAV